MLEVEPTNWRAGCGKSACPVRREGWRENAIPTPIFHGSLRDWNFIRRSDYVFVGLGLAEVCRLEVCDTLLRSLRAMEGGQAKSTYFRHAWQASKTRRGEGDLLFQAGWL
jgi:hypothetical protein